MTINSEQIQALKARYSEPETPNCRICGAKMSIQLAGGGSLVYGCDGRVEGDGYAFKEGRDFADKHYEQSRKTVYNTGDADVIALLAERDADKVLIAELKNDVDAANARVDAGCAQLCNQDEEIEMLRQRIAELEQKHCGGALMEREEHHVGVVNKLLERITEMEASLKAAENNEIDARCHIAELQDRTLKFPPAVPVANWMVGINVYDADLVRELLSAAGITLVVRE